MKWWKRVRFEIRRAIWHIKRAVGIPVGFVAVMWRRIIVGRVGLESRLSARKWTQEKGWVNLGVLGKRCVTDVFCQLIVDYLTGGGSGIGTLGLFKYHDRGTGTTGEDPTDTELEIPTGEARDVGTQEEGTGATIYKSVATYTCTVSAGLAITEHGLFNASAVGDLMDRTVFAAINLELGNRIEFTYELTVVSGG